MDIEKEFLILRNTIKGLTEKVATLELQNSLAPLRIYNFNDGQSVSSASATLVKISPLVIGSSNRSEVLLEAEPGDAVLLMAGISLSNSTGNAMVTRAGWYYNEDINQRLTGSIDFQGSNASVSGREAIVNAVGLHFPQEKAVHKYSLYWQVAGGAGTMHSWERIITALTFRFRE